MLFWLLLVVTRTPVWATDAPYPVLLTSDTTLSTEGYFVLSWDAPVEYTDLSLQTSAGEIRAEHLDHTGSITLTGLTNGDYTYQLLANGQPASNSVTVNVQHPALGRALGFFSLGLLLFGILAGSIFIGNSRQESTHAG